MLLLGLESSANKSRTCRKKIIPCESLSLPSASMCVTDAYQVRGGVNAMQLGLRETRGVHGQPGNTMSTLLLMLGQLGRSVRATAQGQVTCPLDSGATGHCTQSRDSI